MIRSAVISFCLVCSICYAVSVGTPQWPALWVGKSVVEGGVPTDGLLIEHLYASDASDTSGNGYDGTLLGDATASGYLTLDGSGDNVSINDNDAFTFGDGSTDSSFSVSVWARANVSTGIRLVNKYDGGYEYQFDTSGSGKLQAYLFSLGGSHNINVTSLVIPWITNGWYHYAMTYDGSGSNSGLQIYIQGTNVVNVRGGSGYVAMTNTSSPLQVGKLSGTYLNGDVDNLRIYTRELTVDDINELILEGHD